MSAARALARSPTQALLDTWAAEIEGIDEWGIPCPGALLHYWPKVRAYMLTFLDTWGEAAVGMGWTETNLFGVHRAAGMYRVDSCGALVLVHPYVVEAMDAHHIHYTNGLVHRGMTNPADSIPLWDFVRSARARAG